MVLPIFLYGSQVLREKAAEADITQKERLGELVDNLIETMKQADGCGLAAPQVGISERVLVVDGCDLADRFPELKTFHREMINPEFTYKSEETSSYEEGCLSIPGVDAEIVRPRTVKVSYYDRNLEKKEEEFTDFAARMIQHEMDHLDGTVFTDRATPIRRKLLSGRLAGIMKGKVRVAYRVKQDHR